MTSPPPRKPIVGDPRGMMKTTNIDRRQCQRIVPMKVLCLGVSRTGTSSMRQALLDLGYSDYAALMNENPRDSEMWIEAFEAKYEGKGRLFTRDDWDQLLGHCMIDLPIAITDTPCAAFYKELLEAYPDAKVILTVRDSGEQWWGSQMRTIMPFFDRVLLDQSWYMKVYRSFLPPPTAFDRFNVLLSKHYEIYRILSRDLRDGTKTGVQWYEDYVHEIRRIVPEQQLLVMNNREGWKPLCKFLGHETPVWDYPRTNSSTEFDENMEAVYGMMNRVVYWNMAKMLSPVIFSLAAVGLYYLLWMS